MFPDADSRRVHRVACVSVLQIVCKVCLERHEKLWSVEYAKAWTAWTLLTALMTMARSSW